MCNGKLLDCGIRLKSLFGYHYYSLLFSFTMVTAIEDLRYTCKVFLYRVQLLVDVLTFIQ